MNSIKHSVLIISYNQELFIKQAIESVINQDTKPYEIIIGDDCSQDNTWSIINDYVLLYPDIIKAYRNEQNLGIFPNVNKIVKMPTGDVVSFLGGDDFYKPGLFTELNKVISKNSIDYINEKFIIVTNTSELYQDGSEKKIDNYINRSQSAFKLCLRNSINYRAVGISALLLKDLKPTPENIGYHADWLWSLEMDFKCDKHYYTPFVSSVYRVNVGVVFASKFKDLADSRLKVISEIENIYAASLDNADKSHLKLDKLFYLYYLNSGFFNYLIFLFSFISNYIKLLDNCYLKNWKLIIPISFKRFLKFFLRSIQNINFK